ncbi:DUF2807 domain-containing protein, partial [Dysgonomonas sp. Marseille-P4677]|uniref:head GIN domain-containing protein n=1 Tax=Dysgonomonas sp. Marseille-P4677 TaxID=2364790 RepID=UPI001911E9CB
SVYKRQVRGNGNITNNEVNISDYKQLEFSGSSTLIYEQKPNEAPYLRIETDENIYPLLTIESNNGVLTIDSKKNIRPTKFMIYTNSTALEKLSASGSIKAQVKGKLETSGLEFSLSGSGNVVIDSLICQTLKSKASGSADITINGGKVSLIESSISGSGKVNTVAIQADSVYCTVSGSGDFDVWADKYLQIKVSGSGNVRYKGNPNIDKSISGSGKVMQIN